MKKEDEKLVCALMLGDEKGACQALDEGGNPEIIIQTCHSVNTIGRYRQNAFDVESRNALDYRLSYGNGQIGQKINRYGCRYQKYR